MVQQQDQREPPCIPTHSPARCLLSPVASETFHYGPPAYLWKREEVRSRISGESASALLLANCKFVILEDPSHSPVLLRTGQELGGRASEKPSKVEPRRGCAGATWCPCF